MIRLLSSTCLPYLLCCLPHRMAGKSSGGYGSLHGSCCHYNSIPQVSTPRCGLRTYSFGWKNEEESLYPYSSHFHSISRLGILLPPFRGWLSLDSECLGGKDVIYSVFHYHYNICIDSPLCSPYPEGKVSNSGMSSYSHSCLCP